MLSGKAENPSDRKRILRYLALLAILGFAVYYFLPRIATLENSLKVLRSMSVWLVLLAAAAEILSYVGSGYLLKAIMKLGKSRFTIFRGVLITLAAASIGLVMGGWVTTAATTYYWASKEGSAPKESKLTGFLPTLYNDVLMTLLTGVGLLHLLIVHDLSDAQMVLYGTIFFLWVLALLIVVYGMRRPQRIESMAQKVFDGLRRLFRRTKKTTIVHDTVNDVYTGLMLLKGRGWVRPAAGACMNLGFD
ncbi:MAG TPA: lysylphosphatidylglycerol synthase domain-containing protein, partial [Oscillospiraceae bacterium]|nr:lysylphosphatidylglycerol synthase domain-containing protein [Oscillospiraceae bacterium]